ncbi:hypothetical protein [Pseudomonas sp. UBA4617]|uniref:hypothetical protein n=1 Tax=Pseudomonas sp. UBA4617 TaxID=1947318 RepID=UPI0025CE1360|nr:hypothetical protein [Pseudomonas sp. UBA4617]
MAYQHQAFDFKNDKRRATNQGEFKVKLTHDGVPKELVLTQVHFSRVMIFGMDDRYFLLIGCSTGLAVGRHVVGQNQGDHYAQLVVDNDSKGLATSGEIYIIAANDNVVSGSFKVSYDHGFTAEGNFTVSP